MIRSLAVLIVPLLIITFFFTRNIGDHPVTVVDWRPVLAEARREAPYPVLAPVNLPDTWRATQVSWVKLGEPTYNEAASERNAWTLGFLDPSDTYIGLYQGDLKPEDMVAAASRGGTPDGSSEVDGDTWQRLVSPDKRTRSLVLVEPKMTAVVVGDTDYPTLEAYVATLQPQ
jgi:hypothetical protein